MQSLFAIVALSVLVAADPWDGNPIAESFINLGAINNNPATYSCSTYAGLFLPDGVLHSPAIPDASGTAAIQAACEASHNQVDPLISFQTRNIAVQSWNMEKRLAFAWNINGVRTLDQTNVNAAAITAMWMDKNANIETAQSYYDDSLINGGGSAPPWNATNIVQAYSSLGSRAKEDRNCNDWANLFTPTGQCNEPGIPPFNGTSALIKACQVKSARFDILIPAVEDILPVMSWDTSKRVAFTWTLTGVSTVAGVTTSYVVPAITILILTPDQHIIEAWEFWDTSLLPPTSA